MEGATFREMLGAPCVGGDVEIVRTFAAAFTRGDCDASMAGLDEIEVRGLRGSCVEGHIVVIPPAISVGVTQNQLAP